MSNITPEQIKQIDDLRDKICDVIEKEMSDHADDIVLGTIMNALTACLCMMIRLSVKPGCKQKAIDLVLEMLHANLKGE